MTAREIAAAQATGYNAREALTSVPDLHDAIMAVRSGGWSPGLPNLYVELMDELLDRDRFMITADFAAYATA
jgi:starch phosphorylase